MAAKKKTKKKAPSKKRVARKAPPRKAVAKAAPKPRVHEVIHWEIQSQNPERLHSFYAEAFGWKIDVNNPMRYGMVTSRERLGINGGIGGSQAPGSRVVIYASVPDIPAVLDRIQSLGGSIIMPRTDIGPVIMALYNDPEGNTMGLVEG